MPSEKSPLSQALPAESIGLTVGVLLLVCVGIYHTFPTASPSVLGAATVFSASRAMPHVQQIASKPHATGTPENGDVRRYLLGQLKGLGLEGEVQSAFVVNPQKKHAGRIHNVLARIPGTKPGKALLLMAHYDSVPTGPGAADNAASVAAILETLSALKTQPALQNDLICLFTDGEEMGLLGSKAFVEQHPWAKNIGLVFNFEYRGNRGAFMMFETSEGNGKLIEGLSNSVPSVLANSLMYEAYKRLPNDTDFTVFKQAGFTGMNFAAIEGHTSYHTQLDRPDRLDQSTLQQEGDIMLGLAEHFGNIPLGDLKSPDRIYFDVPGLGLMNYPESWMWPLNGLLLLLFTAALSKVTKTEEVRIHRVIYATIIFMAILFGLAIISRYGWVGVCRLYPEYKTFFQGDTYNSHWYFIAFVLLNIGLFYLLYAYACRWLWPVEFSFGGMACWLVLLIAVSVLSPGVSFLFFWPLAGILWVLWIILALTKKAQQPSNTILILLGSTPGLLIFTPLIRNLFIGLTPRMMGVVVFFLVLLLGLLTPLLERIGRQKWLTGLSLLLGFAALGMGSWTSGFDAEHPRQNSLFYVLNDSKQNAYWLSTDRQLDQWTATFFPKAEDKRLMASLLGSNYPDMWMASAPVLAQPSPILEILEDSLLIDKATLNRKLTIRVKSTRNAPKLKIMAEGVSVLSSTVAGWPYTTTPGPNWRLDSIGLNGEGLDIEIIVNAGKPFVLRLIDVAYGLPAAGQQPRPPFTISRPGEFSDTSIIAKVFRF